MGVSGTNRPSHVYAEHESLGESLKTPFVLRTLGVGQGFMVAVTASRKCCAAQVTTRSVGISCPFPAVQPHRQYPDDSPVCSQRQSP
jgi:hypothetical protein